MIVSKIKSSARRFYRNVLDPKRSAIVDALFLALVELVVLESLGLLTNTTPMGDDALVHIKKIVDLARNFLQFQWDPRSFNGYTPSIGFAWASYGPPALFVSLGLDPTIVFHLTFVSYFLLVGPSIYYFARTVGTQRIVSLAISVLGWSTTGYWGYVGGGAYSRVFTLPFMFTALALTYRYVAFENIGQPRRRAYWLLLAAWVLTFLGDVYIGIVPVLVAIPFILFSSGPKNMRLGLSRLGAIFLPALALTAWFWIPLAAHALSVGSPPSDLTVSVASQIFWAGPILSAIMTVAGRRFTNLRLGTEQLAILFALNLVSVYFLIMGAVTPFWPYIPRVWAAYDSFNILSFLFPLSIACLFACLRPLRRRIFNRYLAVFLIILVVLNASITVSMSGPPDRTSLNAAFAQAFQRKFVPSDNYRVSLQGRTLGRWFPSDYPSPSQTGGRVLGLNPSPFYQSWYETEAFFKDDLATLSGVYLEDQPTINVANLIGAQDNFASTTYWLDWYGVSTLVLDQGFYPVQNTAQNFSERGALFSTDSVQTAYGPIVFVNPINPGPVLFATNASTIGFYSQQGDSLNQYNDLLAILSYLGLGSRYIVPVYLSSLDNIGPEGFSCIVTDQYTYSQANSRFTALEGQGSRIIAVPPGLLSQLQTQGPPGTQKLINLISPISSPQVQNLTEVRSFPSQTLTISPQQWTSGYYRNAQGTLQANQNNLTISVTVPDITKTAQFDVDLSLPNPVVLWDQLEPHIRIETSVQSNIGLAFTSSNFTGNSVAFNEKINPGQGVDLQIPYNNFTTWTLPQSKFVSATGFTIAVTIPPGNPNATIVLTYASLSGPGYTIYGTAGVVPLSATGYLEEPTAAGIVLSDLTGNLIGIHRPLSTQSPTLNTPLAAFSSRPGGNFTRVLSIGGSIDGPESLALFPEPKWIPIGNIWATNQDLSGQAVPVGYRGLVWKETFTKNWNILATDQGNSKSSLSYALAGPGLIYVPLGGKSLANLNISYHDITFGLILPIISGLSLAPIIFFRRRIYLAGTINRRSS